MKTKKRILYAARSLFAKAGYNAVCVGDIAPGSRHRPIQSFWIGYAPAGKDGRLRRSSGLSLHAKQELNRPAPLRLLDCTVLKQLSSPALSGDRLTALL